MTEDLVYTDLTKKNSKYIENMAESNYRNKRQTIFCSATIPQRQHFVHLAYKNGWTQTLAELVHVNPLEFTPVQIIHELLQYSNSNDNDDDTLNNNNNNDSDEELELELQQEVTKQKKAYLKYILKDELKSSTTDNQESVPQFIIFVNDADIASELTSYLSKSASSLFSIQTTTATSTTSPTVILQSSQPLILPKTEIDETISKNSAAGGRSSSSRLRSLYKKKYNINAPNEEEEEDDNDNDRDSVTQEESLNELQTDRSTADMTNDHHQQAGSNELILQLDDTMNIDQRAVALERYRSGQCRILVCTDLAARGIDVPSTSLVIQVCVSV